MYQNKRGFPLLALLILLSAATSFAQNPQNRNKDKTPTWVIKEPVIKDSFISIARFTKTAVQESPSADQTQSIFSIGFVAPKGVNFADSAKYQAFYQFTQKLPWKLNRQAILFELASYGIHVPDVEKSLIKLMYDAPEFKLKGTWETDTEAFCYYSIKKTDFELFLGRITDMVTTPADSLYSLGLEYKRRGYPIEAADCFAQALNAFQPLCFQCCPIQGYEGSDLGHAILEEYLNAYKDIAITPNHTSIPAAFGESIPIKLKLKVSQRGKPISGIPIISGIKAEKENDSCTNREGIYTMAVTKVLSSQPRQNVLFEIDSKALFDITPTVADDLFKKQALPTSCVALELFDPSILIKIDMPDYDSTLVEKVQETIVGQRPDVMIVNDFERADLIVKIYQNTELESSLHYDKVDLNVYNTNLAIDVLVRKNSNKICGYNIDNYKFNAKISYSPERVFHSVSRLLSRLLDDDFSLFVKAIQYNKRNVIWETYLQK